MAPRRCWLVKSDPESFSWDDLVASPRRTTRWDGVRNYLARNHLRAMARGDEVLVYHSQTDKALRGSARVVREAYPDPTAPSGEDWSAVDLQAVAAYSEPIGLDRLRGTPGLEGLELLRRGSRLSVHPVSPQHRKILGTLARLRPL